MIVEDISYEDIVYHAAICYHIVDRYKKNQKCYCSHPFAPAKLLWNNNKAAYGTVYKISICCESCRGYYGADYREFTDKEYFLIRLL